MNDMMNSMQQSPQMGQTNFIMQEDHVEEREKAYANAFSDQAYNVFSSKFPNLVSNIVTFKIIKSSIDNGDAIGAFILSIGGDSLYVPVVMALNKFKPLDLIYSKAADKFLPFTKEWMQILTASSTQALGEGVKAPSTLEGDKDITNLMRPPLYGRAVYAMDLSGINHLDLIKEASNETKDAYKKLLKDHPEYLKFATEHFGQEAVLSALKHKPVIEKTASVPVKLEVLDAKAPTVKIKETFGHKANEAMKDMALTGFAYKDERPSLNKVISATEMKLTLEEPGSSGVYELFDSDGSTFKALVIVNPEALDSWELHDYDHHNKHNTYTYGDHSHKPIKRKDYMVIKENGDFFYTHKLVGSPASREDFGGSLKSVVFGDKKNNSVVGSNVCFIKTEGDIVAATKATKIDKIETGKDGFKKYVRLDPYAAKSIGDTTKENKSETIDLEIVHSQTPTGKILRPGNCHVAVVPKTYKVVKLGDRISTPTHLGSAREVLEYVQIKANGTGGRTVKLANLGAGEYSIDGVPFESLKDASVKLAEECYIPMRVAVQEFKKLASLGDSSKIIVTPSEKMASIFDVGGNAAQMTPENMQQMYQQPAQPQMPQMPQMPQQMEQPNTAMMDIATQTQDPELYNVGALNSLAQYQDIKELLSVHSPILEKALDSSGRMLLTFWIKGKKAVQDLGDEAYFGLEESLRTVFRELGGLLLKLNQRAAATPDASEMG